MKKLVFILLFTIHLFGVNILILNSYSPTLKWTSIQTHTLIDKLEQNVKNLNLYVECMNTKQFRPTPKRYKNYISYLKNKYNKLEFDIVIITDDNALNFVRMYKNESIFKKAKIFFEGINNLSLANKLDKSIYAGVFEKKNPLSNLEIAKKIKPNLKTVYVVSDASTSGNKTIKEYKNAFKQIKNINFIYLNSANIDFIIKMIKNYEKDSVLMLLTFGSMHNNNYNNTINMPKVPQMLSKYYNNPILVHADIYANIPHTNIVGGDCTDAKQQATLNTNKVFEYLNGKKMENIGFTLKGANEIYLNVKNLQKFGVNAYKLNIKDAIYVNKPTSFYEIYKIQIISTIVIIILILIFIIILAHKNREINQLNKHLKEEIKKEIKANRKKEQILFQQSKLAAMGEMIGAIAHQWRQPLNALSLNIQLLVDDYLDNKIDKKYLENFESKQIEIIQFMSKTIDDFRNFFSQDKEKINFSLKESVEEVIKLIDKQLQDHNIKIELISDTSEVRGYKNEFKQVILNLINNAKDAIVENHILNGKIEIIIKNNTIFVRDNGGGIPEKIKERIFEPYFTTKDQGKGTGIGLYMSKIIIEEHLGGSLSFKNTNSGTEFIIDLKEMK